MQIGIIGLGRMGGNMAERLRRAGHEVVGYARHGPGRDVDSLEELVARLVPPRTTWVMIPAGEPTQQTIAQLRGLLEAGDLVIDGGNSHYTDDRENARRLGARKIGFIDAGVSGGIWGLQNGYGLMVGGEDADVTRVMPIFEALKPPGDAGFVHAGMAGAGHFAKMVHNGIEYGIMEAYAEGYELLTASDMMTDVAGTFRSW
ncbi:MAG TPA: NAD(P)-binding domain-containing protein, partial [Streptosporangiaceae bacterium]|nr:NAD(P)-binding domain-containing protein [Streptosporangiaceae bacterium]